MLLPLLHGFAKRPKHNPVDEKQKDQKRNQLDKKRFIDGDKG